MNRPLLASVGVLVLIISPASVAAQPGSIAGRIVDSARTTPVPGAEVRLVDPSGLDVAIAATDPNGRYRLNRLAVGEYHLRVRRMGFAPREVTGVRVVAGAAVTIDIALVAGVVILPEVSTTVTRSPVPEEVTNQPAGGTVIGRAEVEERSALTVADHLKSVRGVAISEGGLLQINMVARGFNNIFSGSLLTIIDHRFASVPSLRVNVPAFFPTTNDDIEQIEFVLGPGSALYGPNANSGILHIITKSPITEPGTTLTLETGFRSGTPGPGPSASRLDKAAGVFRFGFRQATKISPKVGIKMSGEYLTATDWRYADRADSLAPGTAPGSKRVCRGQFGCRDFGLERWGGEIRLDIRPEVGTEWVTSVGQTEAVNLLEPTAIGTAQARHWRFRHAQTRFRRGRLFVQGFVNTSNAGETFLLRDGSPIVDESRVWALQGQHGFDLGSKETVLFGADFARTDPRTGGTINGSNEATDGFTEVGGYLHSITRLMPKLDLVSALRVDKHSRIDHAVWSPRVALVAKVAEEQSVRLTYNRAFSTPTSTDLFLDITAGQAGPYLVRALGVPRTGFRFRVNGGCSGGLDNLCMRSPFTDALALLPARASLLWHAAVEAVVPYLPPEVAEILRGIPATSYQQVATALGRLNPTTQSFDPASPSQVQDIGPLKPTISNILEAGYQGSIGRKVRLAVEGYYERRENFVGPLIVESPSVFLDRSTLVPLLRQVLPQVIADQVAGAMLQVPLGTVVPNDGNPFTNRPDIFLTSRNFGTVDLFGADAAVDFLVNRNLAFAGTYSWVNKDLFSPEDVNGPYPITLNASRSRASVTARVSNDKATWSGEVRARSLKGFPVSSGVFKSPTGPDGLLQPIDGYTIVDLQASWRPPVRGRHTLISASVSNLFDKPYSTFVGVPRIGRLVMTKISHTF